MIRLENISLVTAGGREILRDISWHIREDQNWVLFGRNGSGKTRLLEVLTGYVFPTRGEVKRFGHGQAGSDIRQVRKRIGYVSNALKDRFTMKEKARDIILSGMYASIGLYIQPTEFDISYSEDLLAASGLAGRGGDPLCEFSDGERQKLMISRALINRPDILVLDEPAYGLDFPSREDLLESLAGINALRKIPVVYVTHHVEEITPMFNRIFIIHEGSCFFQGPVSEGLQGRVLSELFRHEVEVVNRRGRYSMIPVQKR